MCPYMFTFVCIHVSVWSILIGFYIFLQALLDFDYGDEEDEVQTVKKDSTPSASTM